MSAKYKEDGNGYKRKNESFSGIVHGEMKFWTSRNNISCAQFFLKTESGLFQCMAFRETADAMKKSMRQGAEISLLGYFRDEVDKGDRMITVQTYTDKADSRNTGELSHEGQLIREYGSLVRMREIKMLYEKEQEALGIVKANGRMVNKRFCVKVDSKWYLAIEWLMEVLGADVVEGILREYDLAEIISGHNEQYKRAITDLVALAESDSGKQALRD